MRKDEKMFKGEMSSFLRHNATPDLIDTYLKYTKVGNLYNRFKPVVEMIKKRGFKKGIDFGCATGGLTVLGHINGIEITGVDVPRFIDRPNPLTSISIPLRRAGYPIVIRDTLSHPWDEFEDDSAEFFLAFNSFIEDYEQKTGSAHMDEESEELKKRIDEVARIVKRKGLLYIGGRKMYTYISKNPYFIDRTRAKDLTVKIWGGDGKKGK